MITALVLVAGLMVVPAALAQEDEVTVQEGPPLTASPTPSANLKGDVRLTTTTPTATVQEGPPLSASPTATVPAKAQYDGGGKKKEVVVGGGGTLPETGGVSSIALLAGALLIGGGVMSLALFRRS